MAHTLSILNDLWYNPGPNHVEASSAFNIILFSDDLINIKLWYIYGPLEAAMITWG